jgi:hypothetical protein
MFVFNTITWHNVIVRVRGWICDGGESWHGGTEVMKDKNYENLTTEMMSVRISAFFC